jgi:alkyldihydroxyacetonephosphate synthase
MQRWNGWGDPEMTMDLAATGQKLLIQHLGPGKPRPDYPLSKLLKTIPKSRLPSHPLISDDPRLRLTHAHGQSLPDWIDMRTGALQRFPDGVALPAATGDIGTLLKFAAKHNLIVIPYGGGTSVVGHLKMPDDDRPVLSLALQGLNRLTELNPTNRLAAFEAGVRGIDLEAQLRTHGFTLGHYPQSFEYSTLGGWVVTRSSGQQSAYYGRIEHLFAGGQLVTPHGQITMPPYPASAAGPDLRQLVLGSEGRMGILTQAIVRISPLPEQDDVYGLFFPSWESAQEAVRSIAGSQVRVAMIRLSNPTETQTNLALAGHARHVGMLKTYLRIRRIRVGKACMCLIGFIGTKKRVASAKSDVLSICRNFRGVNTGKPMGEAWKNNRFLAPYLRNTLWDSGYAVDTVETAVTWDRVTDAMRRIETAIQNSLAPWNEKVHVFSHLSHVYPSGSSIYTTFVWRLADRAALMAEQWRTIKQAASNAIVQAGGTISHQHGVGLDHRPYLEAEKGSTGIEALKAIFTRLDPDQRMNPTKLLL